MTEEELRAIVGTPLPGGSYTIEPYVDWMVHDATESGKAGDVAHPIFGFITGLRGKGISLDELFTLCGSSAEDGPMFGEYSVELHQPLRRGETYRVSGEFLSAERKQGKKAGVFDIVGFSLLLTDSTGELVATTYNSFVFPRRSA